MNRRGAVLVMFVFTSAAFMLFFQGTLELIRLMTDAERAQTIADTTVLSSLRLRAKALRTIAGRWDEMARDILAADTAGVLVPASKWGVVTKSAQELSSSLSGYQGRITAVVTVLAGAYGVSRTDIGIEENAAGRLGILAQPFLMRDEDGSTQWLSVGWYKRTWNVDADLNPTERLAHRYGAALSTGQLLLDADSGNGGYPADWTMVLQNNKPMPHRYPYFRAELVEP